MRQIGLFQIHDGGDYGILWPLVIAGIWAPRGEIREWIQDLLYNWPREGMIVNPVPIGLTVGSNRCSNMS